MERDWDATLSKNRLATRTSLNNLIRRSVKAANGEKVAPYQSSGDREILGRMAERKRKRVSDKAKRQLRKAPDWWKAMTVAQRKKYLKEHPNSKYKVTMT